MVHHSGMSSFKQSLMTFFSVAAVSAALFGPVEDNHAELFKHLPDQYSNSLSYGFCSAACQGDLLEISNMIAQSIADYRRNDRRRDQQDPSREIGDPTIPGQSYSTASAADGPFLSGYHASA